MPAAKIAGLPDELSVLRVDVVPRLERGVDRASVRLLARSPVAVG